LGEVFGMTTVGCIDKCQQVHLAGWAVEDGKPATIEVLVNDCVVGRASASICRPDVAVSASDLPELCGFEFCLPRAVGASDTVAARFATSKLPLTNSPAEQHLQRVRQLGFGIQMDVLGIEIGPLDRPFLDRGNYRVLYVDHADRVGLLEKYRTTGSAVTFDASHCVEVDIVWEPGKPLREYSGNHLFGYAIASQVIEHVADPIGWLNEIAAVLKPGARVNLSIPDKRLSFDYYRELSSPAEVIDAHQRRLSRPSFAHVFDHISNVCHPPKRPNHTSALFDEAYNVAKDADHGQYVDVHCHVWTLESFMHCWEVIEALGLCAVQIDRSWTPIQGSNEFIVSFVSPYS
jgi:SAM-dependent methyltransferase